MKKTAVLLAGLLLVTGTVFADWDVTDANVEGTFNLIDTQEGMNMDSGDYDLEFELSKQLDDNMKAWIELNFDEDEENDIDFGVKVTEGDFTIQMGAKIEIDSTETDDEDGLHLTTKNGDEAYIAWNVMGADVATLTVYPYELDMEWDNDTFEAFKDDFELDVEAPGFKVAFDATDDIEVTAKMTVTDNGSGANAYAYKAEVEGTVANADFEAFVGLVPESEDAGVNAVFAMGALAELSLDAITVNAEFVTQTEAEADGDDDVTAAGLYAKAAYALAEMNGYEPSVYVSFTSLNEEANEIAGNDDYGNSNEIEAGLDLVQGSVTVTPFINIISADEDVFGEEEEGSTETNSAMAIGITFAYDM